MALQPDRGRSESSAHSDDGAGTSAGAGTCWAGDRLASKLADTEPGHVVSTCAVLRSSADRA